MEVPIVGKWYNCYIDGKVKQSKRYEVVVKEVIPFNRVDENILELWKSEIKELYWLLSNETDFFIKTITLDSEEEFFVRTIGGGWFSIGVETISGRLDIDDTLTETLAFINHET